MDAVVRLFLALAGIVAITGCGRSGGRGAADAGADVPSGCPPAGAIEALHAAAFHFEHRDVSTGRDAIVRARRLLDRAAPDSVTQTLLADLERLAALPVDLDRLHYQADQVRFVIGEWRCLTPELHARFHAVLPPI